MEKVKDFVEHELQMLDKSIVATPNEQTLEQFTQANNGTNDFLLMQMAKNFGYKLALLNIKDRFYE
tara:strand:+ start:665 stop:862 length:198 start_codon:yes stop_codon:yes gene_type:complete